MAAGSVPSIEALQLNPRRFLLTGVVSTAIDLGVVVGLMAIGFGRAGADVIALAIAALVGRRLHHRYTLRGDELDRWIRQPAVFVAVALVAGAVDLGVFLTVDWAVGIAKLAAIVAAAIVRLVLYRLVLFRVVRREQGTPRQASESRGGLRLSVVVPAYNEHDRIAGTIGAVREQLGPFLAASELEVIVVDDGSSDRTDQAAEAGGADKVVRFTNNRGKGAAVRAGMAASTGRTVAFTDADLAYRPDQLIGFVKAIESGFDVAIGNRHDHHGKAPGGPSVLRSVGSRLVNMATHLLLLGNYRDTQCGCKAFRSDVAHHVAHVGFVDGFAFDIEVLHLVERYELSMVEIPVEVVHEPGSTVRAVRDGVRILADIVRIRWMARRGRYPRQMTIASRNLSD